MLTGTQTAQPPVSIAPVITSTGQPVPVQAAPTPQPLPTPVTTPPLAVAQPTSQVATPIPTQQPVPTSKLKSFARWAVVLALLGQGFKGFFDSLYFTLVEFSNFEKALEDRLIEPKLINELTLKAALLIFATALSVFFAMQLAVFSPKGTRWFKIVMSVFVGVACTGVLYYANTINVVDVFK